MSSGVYLVVCLENGRRYIGSSCKIERRWKEHRYWLNRGEHHNTRWQKDWKQYGAGQFQWSILEIVPPNSENLAEREQYWVDTLNPEFNVNGNVTWYPVGVEMNESTKKKISEAHQKNWRGMSEDQREERRKQIKKAIEDMPSDKREEWLKKISHPHTDVTKEILRQKAFEQFKRQGGPNLGRHVSEETKQKLRETALKQHEKTRAEREQKKAEWEAGRAERKRIQIEKIREANTGKHLSAATKKKLSKAAKIQMSDPAMKIKHQEATRRAMQDPETLRRLSESHKGKKMSKEQRKKISAALKGRKIPEEQRKRMIVGIKRAWKRRKGLA